MEIINSSLKQEDRQNPISPINSPNSSTNSCNNGVAAASFQLQVQLHNNNNNNVVPPSSSSLHLHHQKPIITTRSEPLTSSNPYPTTFVQADTSSFKQVVQMLTGSTETTTAANKLPAAQKPDIQTGAKNPIPPRRQQGFKLYERRNSGKSFMISHVLPEFKTQYASGFSPRNPNQNPEILSPSILDFPSLVLSPVTPLMTDPFNRSPHHNHHHHQQQQLQLYHQQQNGFCINNNGGLDSVAEEDKAIEEKGFYLYKSPATTPRGSEPRLLPLFPVTSPRVSGSS